MTILGWLFLATSLSFVWCLTGWCFYRVVSAKEEPPEPAQHFHSA